MGKVIYSVTCPLCGMYWNLWNKYGEGRFDGEIAGETVFIRMMTSSVKGRGRPKWETLEMHTLDEAKADALYAKELVRIREKCEHILLLLS